MLGKGLEQQDGEDSILLSEEHNLILTCCWVSVKVRSFRERPVEFRHQEAWDRDGSQDRGHLWFGKQGKYTRCMFLSCSFSVTLAEKCTG